jgi:hypothetical protein
MSLPGFHAQLSLGGSEAERSRRYAAGNTRRNGDSFAGSVRASLWVEDGPDDSANGTDDSGFSGFSGNGDGWGDLAGDGLASDPTPVIWPHSGCIWSCTLEGGHVHCEPLTCLV